MKIKSTMSIPRTKVSSIILAAYAKYHIAQVSSLGKRSKNSRITLREWASRSKWWVCLVGSECLETRGNRKAAAAMHTHLRVRYGPG